MKKVHRLLSMADNEKRKHVLDYTHVDLHYAEDQRKNLVNKFNGLKQDLALHKSELYNLKNTMSINCSLQNEVTRVNLENKSLKDEISDLKKVIDKWTCSKVTLDQLLSGKIPGNIVKALGGKGRRKENNSPKEVLFTKADVSTSVSAPMITSDSEDDYDNQAYLDKNALLSTEQLLLTLMEEVKGIKNQILIPSDSSSSVSQASSSKTPKLKDYLKRPVWYLDSGCFRHMIGVKQYLHKYPKKSGPKVVFGANFSGDTKGYGSMENLNDTKVKQLRSDNGTEFRNQNLEAFLAKAFRVLNIRRQEMEETFHVTFSEDDKTISQTSTKGDAINFNEVNSFSKDKFSKPRTSDTLCNANTEYFSYDSLIPHTEDVVLALDEASHLKSADGSESTELQEDDSDETPIDSREKHIKLVNIIGEPLAGIITRSRIRDSDAVSTSECLYVNFLLEIKPKKLIEALEEEG
ncbi:hypothetical protein Tco_1055066 [Tanacetum coccineum]|uniref:Retrovirus-related Pol polyprotein from transposon TNT 1-94-like beta-barrel domain-containing protein n=1 Tax=Tanacetum coccineum TaxID=301880 RepID=A0ABQ5GYY8_9ASTR